MRAQLWIGDPMDDGCYPIGETSDGAPVFADAKGVQVLKPIGGYLTAPPEDDAQEDR